MTRMRAARASRPRLLAGSTALAALVATFAFGTGVGEQPANAATTKPAASAPRAISATDRAQGAKAHPELVAEYGGAMTGPQATYVETVGKTIAVQSGLSNARGDFTVTLLNSPVNNAFAIPGGYVYITRQLTALMNNEAELAGVLGHEVGHVAARHSAKRQKRATTNAILGTIGSVLAGAVLGDSAFGRLGQQVFSQGSQLLTLSYSRGQETQADTLGINYLKRAGYDSRAMSTVLQSLARQNALEAQLRGSASNVPEWASTHPDPASRVRAALQQAGSGAGGMTNRDTFLTRINGLTYGDDPKQGVVDGQKFVHPDLRLAFQAPNGFYMTNGARAVSINGQSGQAQFGSGRSSGSLESYVASVFAGATGGNGARIAPDSVQRTTVNGIPAAYGVARVQQQGGALDVTVFAYDFGGSNVYHFLAITRAGGAGVFNPMFQSLRRISASEAGEIKPRRLSVVTVRQGDTVRSLSAKMAYTDAPLERFLVLNGLSANAALSAGQKVKIVTY